VAKFLAKNLQNNIKNKIKINPRWHITIADLFDYVAIALRHKPDCR